MKFDKEKMRLYARTVSGFNGRSLKEVVKEESGWRRNLSAARDKNSDDETSCGSS